MRQRVRNRGRGRRDGAATSAHGSPVLGPRVPARLAAASAERKSRCCGRWSRPTSVSLLPRRSAPPAALPANTPERPSRSLPRRRGPAASPRTRCQPHGSVGSGEAPARSGVGRVTSPSPERAPREGLSRGREGACEGAFSPPVQGSPRQRSRPQARVAVSAVMSARGPCRELGLPHRKAVNVSAPASEGPGLTVQQMNGR